MKATFKRYEEVRLPELKVENPSLRLSQLKQLMGKEWLKHPSNPINKQLAELNDSAPGQLPLLASPRTRKGKRIVCHNDGSTEAEPEDQYQKELAELRQYLGQAKR